MRLSRTTRSCTLPAKAEARNRGNSQGECAYVRSPDLQSALERIRQVACRDKGARFTALWHHVYNVDRLREAYFSLKRNAAPGVDGETWQHYGEDLEGNLQELCTRLKRGAYRAKPVRRVYIPKADGRQRPLGVTALEDKVVQRAVVKVLNAIYESDFLGFSYGFRPGRNPHNALDALYVGIMRKRVNWMLCIVKTAPPTKSRTYAPLEFRAEDGETPPLCSTLLSSSSPLASVPFGRCVASCPKTQTNSRPACRDVSD